MTPLRPAAVRRTPGWSAGVEPLPGSTVNASAFELPRSGSTAVVDGATAAASMVPADRAPFASDQPHLVHRARLRAGRRCSSPARAALRSRENTTVAVPPVGMSPDTVRTSGAAKIMLGRRRLGNGPQRPAQRPARRGRSATAAAAASTAFRQRGVSAGGCAGAGQLRRTVAPLAADAARPRRAGGRGGARAARPRSDADTVAMVSRTARTSSAKARATSSGAVGQLTLDVVEFGRRSRRAARRASPVS